MWYWVKLPDNEKTDYNLDELKVALAEGKVQPDWLACRYNETQFHPVQTLLAQDAQEPSQEQPPAKFIFIVCGKCKQRFPIQPPILEQAYSCPNCQSQYNCSKVSEGPEVFVFMTEI
jgi:hypothetical protein